MPFGHTLLQTRSWSDPDNPWEETAFEYNCTLDWETPFNGENPGEFINVSQSNHAYTIHHHMGEREVPWTAYTKINVYKLAGDVYIEMEVYQAWRSPPIRTYTFRVNNLAEPIKERERFRVTRLTTGFWPLPDSFYKIIPFSMEWYNDDEFTPDGDPHTGIIAVGWTLDMLEFMPVARFPFYLYGQSIKQCWHGACSKR